jgi:hypothetical protein
LPPGDLLADKNDLLFGCVEVPKVQNSTGSHVEKHTLDSHDFDAITPVAGNGDRRISRPGVLTINFHETPDGAMARCEILIHGAAASYFQLKP